MSPRRADLDRIRAATLCLLNVERARHDLPALSADEHWPRSPTAYSEKMVRRRFFGHVCPDGSTMVSRIRTRTDYLGGPLQNWALGENLAWGSGSRGTPRAIVRTWMRSARPSPRDPQPPASVTSASASPRERPARPRRAALTYTTEFGYRITI